MEKTESRQNNRQPHGWLTRFKLKPRYPLMLQLLVFIAVVILTTGATVGLVTSNTSRRALRQQIFDANLSQSQLVSEFASNYLKAVESHILVFASRPDIVDAVFNGTTSQLQPTLAQLVQIQTALTGCSIYDTSGIQLVYSAPDAATVGQSFALRDYFIQVAATKKPYLGTPTLSAGSGFAIIPFAVPILDSSGQLRAVLSAGISLTALSEAINGIDLNAKTEITVIDTRGGGRIISSPKAGALLTQPSANDPAVKQVLDAATGVIEEPDATGQNELVGFSPVPDIPWGVAVSTPTSVALAVIDTLDQQTLVYTSVIVLCAVLIGSLWMVNITAPIRKLRDTSKRVADGDFSQRVNLKLHNEIGELGTAFDRMARDLAEYDANLRAQNTELEKRVVERTAQLKNEQDALMSEKMVLKSTLESTADGILAVDNDGKVLDYSSRFLKLWNIPPELAGAANDVTLLNHVVGQLENPAEFLAKVSSLYGTAETSFDLLTFKDGRVFERYSRPLMLGERIQGRVWSFRDVTERRKTEEKIRNMNAELESRVRERTAALEAANRELESFSYSVSHDLRSPLRGIDGWSLALVEEAYGRLSETEQGYLAKVRSETQRLGELIEALLQLARISKADFNKQDVNLSALVEKVAARVKEKYPARNIELVLQPGLAAEGDATLLESVFTNLLDNAWKFTGTRDRARIEFGAMDKDGRRVFYVSDNGVGFDMRYADKLFGAFQRLHKMSEFPGHGVGLATVQRIIHRHGGEIWAEAEINEGATFYFTL